MNLRTVRSSVEKMGESINYRRTKQWLLVAFELAQKVGADLPTKDSTRFQTVMKTVGAIHTVRTVLWKTETDLVHQYAAQYGLEEFKNESFVRIFFSTKLHEQFTISSIKITEHEKLFDCQGKLGHFAFTKSNYSEYHSSTYYVKKDVDIPQVIDELWRHYDGRLYMKVVTDIFGRPHEEFSRFEIIDTPLFGSAGSQMERLLARHRRCRARKSPRTYMCYGPPGTGKSSFSMKFADTLGSRTLKLSAESLQYISVKEMDSILEHLAPEFLLIDDIDKMSPGNTLSTLLEIIQRFKSGDGSTTLMMTSNVITGFDTGLLRPNRIDSWLEFKLPKTEERKEVLRSYAQAMGVQINDEQLTTLAKVTNTLSHDYLREIMKELHECESFDEVLTLIKLMKRLLVERKKAAAAPGAAPALPAPAAVVASKRRRR
jgi:ATPase family associated with various cellular activities (AAA)